MCIKLIAGCVEKSTQSDEKSQQFSQLPITDKHAAGEESFSFHGCALLYTETHLEIQEFS